MSRCQIVGSLSFEDIFSEVYYTFLLGFQSILKRLAYKDLIQYKLHNRNATLDYQWFSTAICFNLFSEYGVGKSLEPLIKELMKKYKLDYETHKSNVFFNEIVLICPEITRVLRQKNPVAERDWAYDYANRSLFLIDGIAQERIDRLFPLFQDFSEGGEEEGGEEEGGEEEGGEEEGGEEEGGEEEGGEEEVDLDKVLETVLEDLSEEEFEELEDIEPCRCAFCVEFEKYLYEDERHIEEVITETIRNIA